MAMSNKGLTKLVEELGELSQIAAKKMAYMNIDNHPDKKGSMKKRLENEMGDVLASIQYVVGKLELDMDRIVERSDCKIEVYLAWEKDQVPADSKGLQEHKIKERLQ